MKSKDQKVNPAQGDNTPIEEVADTDAFIEDDYIAATPVANFSVDSDLPVSVDSFAAPDTGVSAKQISLQNGYDPAFSEENFVIPEFSIPVLEVPDPDYLPTTPSRIDNVPEYVAATPDYSLLNAINAAETAHASDTTEEFSDEYADVETPEEKVNNTPSAEFTDKYNKKSIAIEEKPVIEVSAILDKSVPKSVAKEKPNSAESVAIKEPSHASKTSVKDEKSARKPAPKPTPTVEKSAEKAKKEPQPKAPKVAKKKTEPKAEPKPKPKPEPKPKPKPEPKPEPMPEPKPKPKSEPKPEPKSEPKLEPKPEPKPEPKLERKSEPKPDPKIKSKLEPEKDIEPEVTDESVEPFEKTQTKAIKDKDTDKSAKTGKAEKSAVTDKMGNPDKSEKNARKDKSKTVEEETPQEVVVGTAENSKKLSRKERGKRSVGRIIWNTFCTLASIVLSLGSVYLFLQVFDLTKPDYETAFLCAPLAAQILLAFIWLISGGRSNAKQTVVKYIEKEVASGSAPMRERAESRFAIREREKETEREEQARADLLKPEVEIKKRVDNAPLNFKIDNYYQKNVEEFNGKMYTTITTYDESMRAFEALGATDMELIKVNMAGNAKFTEILDIPRSPTLKSTELVLYFMSKPGAYTIKKRGALNWTFKYSQKSFGMIRENSESYKISVKLYPDAAAKLNEQYMAFEDSNFPSGPLWFCYNELRNLPPRVCKWVIDTSFQISRFQQIKTDKLRVFKTPADMDINLRDIAERYKNMQSIIEYPKYALIFSKNNEADLTTYLMKHVDGLDTSKYTKEYYYKFTNKPDVAVSLLCGKGMSEDAICTFMEHIEEIFM